MALRKYGYAETTKVKATDTGHLLNVINEAMILENGQPVVFDDYAGSTDLYNVKKPESAGDKILMHHSALINKSARNSLEKHEMYCCIEPSYPGRAYETEGFDQWSFADYMIKPVGNAVVKGNYVVVDLDSYGTNSVFYKELAANTDAETLDTYGFLGKIEEVFVKGTNLTIVQVRVVRNENVSA